MAHRRCGGRRRRAILGGIGPRPPHTILPVLLCTLALGACGGGSATPAATPPPRSAAPPPSGQAEDPLALPQGVPLRESGTGDPAAIRVIRLWTDALRRSDVARASSFWAIPSKVQNASPLLTLTSAGDVRAFNASLPCGSRLTSALGARNGFTIAIFKLTSRPGADCGGGTGQHARTAIRVRAGKIAEWYRLPDDPDAPAPQGPAAPQVPAGPIV
jgi:hypothetical protein